MEVMKNYYEGNKDIFKLVEKRETLFKTMEEFEVFITLTFVVINLCLFTDLHSGTFRNIY